MQRIWKADRAVGAPKEWLGATADLQEINGGLASSPLAAPAFFVGWVCLGLLLAATLPHASEERRTIRAAGAGLGPLMLVMLMGAWGRGRSPHPVVLAQGVDHGGTLDVLVLIQGTPDAVRDLGPTLDAVAADIRTLTLARALPHLWLEADDAEAVEEASRVLDTARDLVQIRGAQLAVFVDAMPAAAARGFASRGPRVLVLHALDDTTSTSDRP